MTRRSMLWLVGASLFTVINLAGAGMAAAQGELFHTAAHIVLLLIGAYVLWRLLAPARTQRAESAVAGEVDARLTHLQQSLDSIAVEVERVGEAQRYAAKIVSQRAESGEPESPQRAREGGERKPQ